MSELIRAERKKRRWALERVIAQKTKEFFEIEKAKIFLIAVDIFASENQYSYYLFLKRMKKELPLKVFNNIAIVKELWYVDLSELYKMIYNEFNILYGTQLKELTEKFAVKEAFDEVGYESLPKDFYQFNKTQRKEYLYNEFRYYNFYELIEKVGMCFVNGSNYIELQKVIKKLKKMMDGNRELFFKFFRLSMLVLVGLDSQSEVNKIIRLLKTEL